MLSSGRISCFFKAVLYLFFVSLDLGNQGPPAAELTVVLGCAHRLLESFIAQDQGDPRICKDIRTDSTGQKCVELSGVK